jgi:hypothetical protein
VALAQGQQRVLRASAWMDPAKTSANSRVRLDKRNALIQVATA